MGLLTNGASILGIGGATFRSSIPLLESYATRPEVKENPPFGVIVVLGGDEISKAKSGADVDQVAVSCQEFCLLVRQHFPNTLIALYQVEDRYEVGPGAINLHHKRLGSRYNYWLNKWDGKDVLVTIKGARVLSDASVYLVDGVHLNDEGYARFAQRLMHVIWKLWQRRAAHPM